jgi:hypothetical protein
LDSVAEEQSSILAAMADHSFIHFIHSSIGSQLLLQTWIARMMMMMMMMKKKRKRVEASGYG